MASWVHKPSYVIHPHNPHTLQCQDVDALCLILCTKSEFHFQMKMWKAWSSHSCLMVPCSLEKKGVPLYSRLKWIRVSTSNFFKLPIDYVWTSQTPFFRHYIVKEWKDPLDIHHEGPKPWMVGSELKGEGPHGLISGWNFRPLNSVYVTTMDFTPLRTTGISNG